MKPFEIRALGLTWWHIQAVASWAVGALMALAWLFLLQVIGDPVGFFEWLTR